MPAATGQRSCDDDLHASFPSRQKIGNGVKISRPRRMRFVYLHTRTGCLCGNPVYLPYTDGVSVRQSCIPTAYGRGVCAAILYTYRIRTRCVCGSPVYLPVHGWSVCAAVLYTYRTRTRCLRGNLVYLPHMDTVCVCGNPVFLPYTDTVCLRKSCIPAVHGRDVCVAVLLGPRRYGRYCRGAMCRWGWGLQAQVTDKNHIRHLFFCGEPVSLAQR